jgi:radical SAM protein with 4Fe4S-binding SPASM domain
VQVKYSKELNVYRKIIDSIHFLINLNFIRVWNVVLIYVSYWLTGLKGKIIHAGMPVSISVEPTTACNLRCRECLSGQRQFSRPEGNMKYEDFQNIIDQLHKHLLYLIIYFQGEPYMNKLFFDFVKFARQKRIYTVTSSNGHFLDDNNAKKTVESGLDRLIISLDGLDQETYESYRTGGNFDKVIQGIQNIIRWKKALKSTRPYLIIQFLVLKTNEHQMKEIKKLGRVMGVDEVQFKTAQFYDYVNGNELIPDNKRYSRYIKRDDGTYAIRSKLPDRCFRMWSSCVITWDGRIVPCCFDKDANHQMGNLTKNSFSEIWKRDYYNQFRKAVFTARKKIDICRNCTEGLKN